MNASLFIETPGRMNRPSSVGRGSRRAAPPNCPVPVGRGSRRAAPPNYPVPVGRGSRRAAHPRHLTSLAVGLAFAASLVLAPSLLAGLSEPDNVLYGTITLDGQLITAARTDIVVEARRTTDGPAIVAYRIGDDRRLGGFYRLNLKLETTAPLADPLASLDGDRLYVAVRNDTDFLIQKTIEIGQRGLLTRLDLDAVQTGPDQDGNGLADAWELLHFGRTGNDPQADPDQDGHSNLEEFQAGTAPRDANSVCRLDVDPSSAPPKVSFLARRADGAGYEPYTRYFTLETSPSPATSWKDLAGFTNLAGDGRVVVHPIPVGSSPAFFRLRVWLQAR